MIRHNDLTLSYLESAPGGLATTGAPLVILIHGRGADATDLAPLASLIGGDRPYRFVLPDAPNRFSPAPGIEFGYSWFDGYPPDPASLGKSREKFVPFLGELAERYEAQASRTVLCGFSQGALMALDAGLRSSGTMAGVVALSGGIDSRNLPPEAIRSRPPVLLTAFAATMADRDLEAFASFLAEEAIFSSPRNVLRGRSAIVEGWRAFFEGDEAPFSWRPNRVHVLDDGTIGGTTGPVYNPAGETVGHFVSTWKRQPDGTWKIVMDLSPGDSPESEVQSP